jgi:hypothetical protein
VRWSAGRRTVLSILCMLAGVAAARSVRAQGIDTERGKRIEAGFVLNFLRFTDWPPRTHELPSAPIQVTVVGDSALTANLTQLVRGERIGAQERRVEVRPAREARPGVEAEARALVAQLQESHLVFIGRDDGHRVEWILDTVRSRPVLTVSDVPDFAAMGGMLGLVVRGGRLVFEANPAAVTAAGVNVSSKVLRLARIVEGGRR